MPPDEIRPLYRTIVSLGVAAVVLLTAGVAEFVAFQPFTERTGAKAHVEGVFHYDPARHEVTGSPTTRFSVDDAFAAVVDWQSLPGSMTVGARWYNSLQVEVGGVGPSPASELTDHPIVPIAVPAGFNTNLPGEYQFVVERYSGGQPVELLARKLVLVRRTP